MNISTARLREIIEEEAINLAAEDYEEEPPLDVGTEEEFEQPDPADLRAQMPVEELAQVVMKLVETHPEGMEVLKQALIELYDVDVEEYEEEEIDPNVPVGPDAPPVVQRIGFEESLDQFIADEVAAVLREYTERDPIGRAENRLQLDLPFGEWAAQVEDMGFEFGEESPDPYDAWLQGTNPHDYAQSGGIEEIAEVIEQESGQYVVKSEDGKTLGTHDTKKKARAQLGAIEASKKERGED